MAPSLPDYAAIERELHALLNAEFSGITVEVSHSPRWARTQIVFRWPPFADLLPEERFRQIVQVIPPEYYDQVLRGAVWFELAADESIEEFMSLPRSDDVARDEPRVVRMLAAVSFFDALRQSLGAVASASCGDDLSAARRMLRARGVPAGDVTAACLTFIRLGAFCDCGLLNLAERLAQTPIHQAS